MVKEEYPFEDTKAYYNQILKTQNIKWDNNQKKFKVEKTEKHSGYVNVNAAGTDFTAVTVPSGYSFFIDTIIAMEGASTATELTLYNGASAGGDIIAKIPVAASGFVTLSGISLKRCTSDIVVQSSASTSVDITIGGTLERD